LVLAVCVRVLTRPSDQIHTKRIPDVDSERNICVKKRGPQIDADGHRFAFSVNHICVDLCSSVGNSCRANPRAPMSPSSCSGERISIARRPIHNVRGAQSLRALTVPKQTTESTPRYSDRIIDRAIESPNTPWSVSQLQRPRSVRRHSTAQLFASQNVEFIEQARTTLWCQIT
jgi:hypothetical protein